MAPKPPPAVFGFDAVAAKLHALFLSSRNTPSRSSSETSITSMAFKELRSNFQAPLRGVRRSPSAEAAPSAANEPPRPGVARGAATENSTGRPITPSPASTTTVPCRQLRSASASANRSAVSVSSTASVGRNNFRVADRAHQEMQPVTTTATPMRRLQYSEFVRLNIGSRFTIVVPPSDRYDNDEAKKGRAAFLASARRLVLHGRGKLSADEREEFWQEELSSRTITRGGKEYHEFHVVVRSFPERDVLEETNLPDSLVKNVLKIGAGLLVDVRGLDRATSLLIKLNRAPYLEFFQVRESGDSFIDDAISFPKSKKSAVRLDYLDGQLKTYRGDACSYVEILMKYFQRELKVARDELKTNRSDAAARNERESSACFDDAMSAEMSSDDVKSYANYVDGHYRDAMELVAGSFVEGGPDLLPPGQIFEFYLRFQSTFPLCHSLMKIVVETGHYKFPERELPTDDDVDGISEANDWANEEVGAPRLEDKERKILFLFLALIRTRSRNLLKYWSHIEPLAFYFKGYRLPGRASMSGGFNSTLDTCWKEQEELHSRMQPSFLQKLRGTQRMFVAFDNHNKVHMKKNITEGKTAITHIGTYFFAKEERPLYLPPGTTMTSPRGVRFKVVSCNSHSVTHYLARGTVVGEVGSAGEIVEGELQDELDAEKDMIREGFFWPTIGWAIESMPGFPAAKEVTYQCQDVPGPRMAWVGIDASTTDLVLNHDRPLMEPNAEGGRTWESSDYYDASIMAQRIVTMSEYSKELPVRDSFDHLNHEISLAVLAK